MLQLLYLEITVRSFFLNFCVYTKIFVKTKLILYKTCVGDANESTRICILLYKNDLFKNFCLFTEQRVAFAVADALKFNFFMIFLELHFIKRILTSALGDLIKRKLRFFAPNFGKK